MWHWLRRLRARIKYRDFDRDLAREIETHRALKADEHRDRGLAPADARDAAARDLGNVTLMREDARGVWIAPWLQSVWQDLRYAAASYRRQPGFTIGAVLVLSLGTGLVTVGFSLAHATFLRPWQVPNPSSVVLARTGAVPGSVFRGISIPEFMYLRAHAASVDLFFSLGAGAQRLVDGENALGSVESIYVSDNYFSSLQLPMLAGRGFLPSEGDYQSPVLVAVITDRLWRDRFGRDPGVIGRMVGLGYRQVKIIGVSPTSTLRDNVTTAYDLALPLAALATERRQIEIAGKGVQTIDASERFRDPRDASPRTTIAGRLASGAASSTAAAEIAALSAQFRASEAMAPIAISLVDTRPVSRDFKASLWSVTRTILLALSVVFALVCANVGNMTLARSLSRRREIGVRLALGAGRPRLIRQLLTETALLSAAAAAIGFAVCAALPAILDRFVIAPESRMWERAEFYAPTMAVFAFTLAAATGASLLCGLAPALRATRLTVHAALDRHGADSGRVWLQRALLAMQIAMTAVLLVGAGLMTRGVTHALESDTGLAMETLHVVSFDPAHLFPSLSRHQEFFRQLARGVEASGLPVAFIERPPLADDNWRFRLRRPDQPPQSAQFFTAFDVTPAFFDISGVRLLAGRAPRGGAAVRELVVGETTAKALWPGADPIGQTLIEANRLVVVGVASDAALNRLTTFDAVVYKAPEFFRGVLLTQDASPAAIERIRAIAAGIEPDVQVSARPLMAYARESVQMAIVGRTLAWAIGGLGVLLAIVGAMGVFAYAVEERRREIGIRLALGARPWQVVATMLRTSQVAALAGLAAGWVLSVALAPLLRGYLYGLSPFDPQSYAQITVILLAAAAIASWLPARRAVRINPIETLKVD